MEKSIQILFLVCISWTGVLCQYNSPNTQIDRSSVVSASYNTYISSIDPMCVTKTTAQNQRVFPTGQSMENLIALIERLEIMLANDTDQNLKQHLGADNVAKLLLRRFRFDGYDRYASSSPNQHSRDQLLTKIANAFFTQTDSGSTADDKTFYFPDQFFSQAELCSLYSMLSHNVYNTDEQERVQYSSIFRGKRQAYNNRQQQQYPQQNYGSYGKQNTNQNQHQIGRQYADTNTGTRVAVQSNFLVKFPIKEEGVVSFRGNQDEAIAPARVLLGVIAGLTTDLKTSANQVLRAIPSNLNLVQDTQIDPVMALTVADLWGVATGRQDDETKYYYGLKGQWTSGSCTTHYALTDVTPVGGVSQFLNATRYMKATKAEIRGGIDGYLIGKNLKSLGTIDAKSVRLSTILRSFYSKPKTQKSQSFTVSYCNRDQQINIGEIQTTATAYAAIVKKYSQGPDSQLLTEFNTAFTSAQQKETGNGYTDYCSSTPSGTLDKSAPCETPSDVIYVIDATTTQKLTDSAKIVSLIDGNLINMRTEGGTVSIFANSAGPNNVNSDVNSAMPRGPVQWPLLPIAFNSTNTGYAQCRIDDFNSTNGLPPLPNMGKYLSFLNQTLFFYEWWGPRANSTAVPAKTAVLIDYDSTPVAPDSGNDRNDYNYYKDQLRYRHRDVKFLTVSNNQKLFEEIIREDTDKDSPNNILQIASVFSKKICENPATFQHNSCNWRTSNNDEYVGFVTPGYKQNWAMYPEFFLKSFDIYFKFKPEDGDIKVCYNRWANPENQELCKELKSGEEHVYHISNPCKGESFSSCQPLYFTVWGKDRTTPNPCTDPRCLSLDQIKFTVTHSGVQCSSSNHLLPSTTFQLISLSIIAILYLFLNK